MSVSTYAELCAEIRRIANRDDLSDETLSNYVRNTEADATSKLRVRQMICRSEADISNEYETLATNYCGVKAMSLISTNPCQPLKFVDAADIRDQKLTGLAVGRPRLFSIIGPEVQFFPPPDATYTVELIVFENIPSLEEVGTPSAQTDHWLFYRYPHVMIWGGLTQFGKDFGSPNLPTWEGAYEAGLAAIRQADGFEHHSNRPTQRLRRFG